MILKLIFPIILQLIGVVVIIAEFLIPTAGLLAILSIGLFGYSLYVVFTTASVAAGIGFVVADVLMLPIVVVIGIKLLAASPATLKATLDSKDGAVSQPPEWKAVVGFQGNAVTDLHPAGTAMISGRKYDVVSRGEYITKGSGIVVLAADSNRIVVKKKEEADTAVKS